MARIPSLAAHAEARHPCTPAADLGPGRYARRSVVVFPLQVDADKIVTAGSWTGADPEDHSLAGPPELLASVSAGLFATDWPLPRFDAWATTHDPDVDASGTLLEQGKALKCTDVAVIPRVVDAELTVEGNKIRVTLGLDVFQRDAAGALTRTHELRASVPGIVDSVEDIMLTARQSSVDKIRKAIPVDPKKLDQAEVAGGIVLDLLPAAQAAPIEDVVKQTALGATRVASVARPAVVLPMLEDEATNPAVMGLRWRGEEDECYIHAPKADDEPERVFSCALLSRVRQAVRQLQLDTRRIESFRLTAPFASAYNRPATPLGEIEGVRVGDGYFLQGPEGRMGYARVRRVGDGGADGLVLPSRLQVVYGPRAPAGGSSVREDPRLGIEIGLAGGLLPANHPAAGLPSDPVKGTARDLGDGSFAPTGHLRFDVNLGRTAKLYEWYQTNRVIRGFSGPLRHGAATFGLERRFQVMPRTSVLAGLGVTVGSWSVPSGVLKAGTTDEELRAGAGQIGGEAEMGFAFLLSPSLVVRATGTGHLAKSIDAFSWSDGDLEGTVIPVTSGGAFRLRTSGVGAAISTAWVF